MVDQDRWRIPQYGAGFFAPIVATGLGSTAALGTYLWLQQRDQRERAIIRKQDKLQEIFEASLLLRYAIERSEQTVQRSIDAAIDKPRDQPTDVPDFSSVIERATRVSMRVECYAQRLKLTKRLSTKRYRITLPIQRSK